MQIEEAPCGVECDGGSISFTPMTGSDSLELRISDTVNRFRMTWGYGEDDGKYAVLSYDPAVPAIRLDRPTPRSAPRLPAPGSGAGDGTKFPRTALWGGRSLEQPER